MTGKGCWARDAPLAGDWVTAPSLRGRVLDWTTAIVVAIGVVASIPMVPILLIALLVMAVRSPGLGSRMFGAVSGASGLSARGRVEGFPGALLFPLVVLGWMLIALLAGGVVAGGFNTGDGGGHPSGQPAIGLLLGLVLLVCPTFLVYRSMYPEISEVPFDEWLGGRRPRLGVGLLLWIAWALMAWSVTTWTTFLGSTWTTVCSFIVIVSVLIPPGVFLLVRPVGGPRMYRFLAAAFAFGLVSVAAWLAGMTPAPRWP